MNSAHSTAAGAKALPDQASAFASTQTAWRFYQNPHVSLDDLAEPLVKEAINSTQKHCQDYSLVAHDWSHINYSKHKSKQDTYAMTHKRDVGYELQSSLLISDKNGAPLAPIAQNLVTAEAVLSSYQSTPTALTTHLDELSERIRWIEQRPLDKKAVHIIDREASSIAHMRAWQALGALWLIRSKDNAKVDYQGESLSIKQVAETLTFTGHGRIAFKNTQADLQTAQANIVITRKAKPKRIMDGKRVPEIAGEPLSVRLIVSRVISQQGECLAQWCLLSNVQQVPPKTLAQWYYWRWQIESFYKLLKSSGHHMEHWQQETGMAIAKRLMVASMACVYVWQLYLRTDTQAEHFKKLLTRLSGRQLKRAKPVTHQALLAGLWVFLSMMDVMNTYTLEDLQAMEQMFRLGVV